VDDQSVLKRFWEIDALRGVAILMMILYHLMWDLLFFGVLSNVALQTGFWKYFQRVTASTFIFLVGVSLVISYQRMQAQYPGHKPPFAAFFWRGVRIFSWGMLITFVVRYGNIGRIDFGVLHLIGFAVVAAYPFLPYRWLNLALWLLFNGGGYFLQPPLVPFPWFVWLGLKPPLYVYLDYFPLIPWFGVVLLGVSVGNFLYSHQLRRFPLPDWSTLFLVRLLRLLGQHSLKVYLLHQPLLLGALFSLIWMY
jgi:uncharacterized membrane protein